jgi:hypothetical protein
MTFSGFWLILFHISFDIQFSFSVWFLLIISNVLHCCFQAICKSCTYILHVHFSISSPPLIYMWVSVCTFMCIYLFSCPSVPAPQLLIFHREYLVWCIVVVYQS